MLPAMDSTLFSCVVETALGPLSVTERDGAIVRLRFGREGGTDDTPLLREAARQLQDYAAGRRRDFDLPLAPEGGPFETRVWRALSAIPFGATRTYGALARELKGEARAVGQACGANPIPVIIPCHRVLSAAGSGGFSAPGGVDTKYRLLVHEGAALL
ncbi:MAG TPA: methylated-DNA--[protein]-cysteine S-methyltransferase [Kiloniellales bacterium]|nr:methylated-DNA--[protein]-cysteine S-methyltransferase [Kiloniellales bacterium]